MIVSRFQSECFVNMLCKFDTEAETVSKKLELNVQGAPNEADRGIIECLQKVTT